MNHRFDEDSSWWAFMSAVDYAKATGKSLLCDDVALRQFARSEGVATFGSAALVEILEGQGRVTGDERVGIFTIWRGEFCVDLPGTDELLDFARSVQYCPGPAALTMARPAFWQDGSALACYRTLVDESDREAPQHVAMWVYAATLGCSTGRQAPVAAWFAADLLVQTIALAKPGPETFAQMVGASRDALKVSGGESYWLESSRRSWMAWRHWGHRPGPNMFSPSVQSCRAKTDR